VFSLYGYETEILHRKEKQMIDSKYLLHTNAVLETKDYHKSVTGESVTMNEKTLGIGERWESEVTRTFVNSLITRVKNSASNIQHIIADVLRGDELEQVAFCVKLCEDVVEHFTTVQPNRIVNKDTPRPEWLKRMGDVFAEMPAHIVVGAVRSRMNGMELMLNYRLNSWMYNLPGQWGGEWKHMISTITAKLFDNKQSLLDYQNMRRKYRDALEDISVVCYDAANLGQ
jgi:hypothetical protein